MVLKQYPDSTTSHRNQQADRTRRIDLRQVINLEKMDLRLFAAMTSRQAVCFYLRYHAGMKYKQISEALGLGISTVRKHIMAADLEFVRMYDLMTSRRHDG